LKEGCVKQPSFFTLSDKDFVPKFPAKSTSGQKLTDPDNQGMIPHNARI
jgi:hypothetical protein